MASRWTHVQHAWLPTPLRLLEKDLLNLSPRALGKTSTKSGFEKPAPLATPSAFPCFHERHLPFLLQPKLMRPGWPGTGPRVRGAERTGGCRKCGAAGAARTLFAAANERAG